MEPELVDGGNVVKPGVPARRSVFYTPGHAVLTVAIFTTAVLMGIPIVFAQAHTLTAVRNYEYVAIMSSIGFMFWFIHKRTVMPIFALCLMNAIMLAVATSLSAHL